MTTTRARPGTDAGPPPGTLSLIERAGIVAVLRAPTARHFRAVTGTLVAAGVRAVEVTLTAEDAIEAIAALAAEYGEDVAIGAGTVLTADAAEACVAAGAGFLVAPTAVPDVVATAQVFGVAVFPGGLTPTEVLAAHRSGADGVKVFPASAVRPSYLKDLHAPLPGIRLMPTGGIAVADVAAWIGAGAFAVGLGGSFLADTVHDGPDQALKRRAKAALDGVARGRGDAGVG